MTVTFRLPGDRPLDLVSFAWSPLFEAALTLPVLAQPKRTPMHLPWVRRCRELPPDLLEELRTLGAAFGDCIPGIFEVGFRGASVTFEDELAALAALDDDTIADELSIAFGGLGCPILPRPAAERVRDPEHRAMVLAGADASGPERGELARRSLDDPAALRERITTVFERYWEAAFADEWARLLPRIEAEVTDGARALVTRGVPGLVAELLPEGRWDERSSSLVVDKTYDATRDVAERGGLLFVPTVYGWPCVLLELHEPWPLAVFFPLRDLRQPEVLQAEDGEVASGLRALGDPTRLQITRLVAEQPRSTKELAELLRLSDSAVSRHLKTLDAAGVVTGERDGYFVLYRLRPERIGQLGGALRRTLGLSGGGGLDPLPPLPVSLARPTNPTTHPAFPG